MLHNRVGERFFLCKAKFMKVLVTGAAGFIGAALCRRLLNEGHEVIGVDNFSDILYPSEVKRARLVGLASWRSWSFAELDVSTDSLGDLLNGVHVVVNEAAVPGLLPSWDSFESYSLSNTVGVHRILRDLKERPEVHLVHASTSSVYGKVAIGDEEGPTEPVSPYGVTKLAAENLIRIYRQSFGISATVLRYFSVFGPEQRPDMAYALFCRALLSGQPLMVTGDGAQRRSNTYIDDVVDATVRAAEARCDGLTANVCGDSSISLLEAIAILGDELRVEPQVHFVAARAGDQRETSGKADRAAMELGWTAQTPIDLGLRHQARAAMQQMTGGFVHG